MIKSGRFGKGLGGSKPLTATKETTEKTVVESTKASPFGKKKFGGLNKKVVEEPIKEEVVQEEPEAIDIDKDETVVEEAPATVKPAFGKKKLGGLKKTPAATAQELEKAAEDLVKAQTEGEQPFSPEEPSTVDLEADASNQEDMVAESELGTESAEEEKPAKKTGKGKKKTTKAVKTDESVVIPSVDESKRVSVNEMDNVMRAIVAPTTETWEQEKTDVLTALDNIKVSQDMTMTQVKHALSELDSLKFEVLPKQHDAETMFDGTKQNYDTVKAIAIANGSATNAEARKAEGILACRNYVTPSGEVVDLHQYMLLIEERHKFYQKIVEAINFKKYSLVNYNNALKIEAKEV